MPQTLCDLISKVRQFFGKLCNKNFLAFFKIGFISSIFDDTPILGLVYLGIAK